MRLRRLEPVLRRALRGPCRLPRGATLLVAVSGGADSTALLVALASLAPEFGLSLHAAHLHHGLRGREADEDLRFVRELCERLQTPLTAARWDCRARMRRRGLSGEAGLRTLRREYLSHVARLRRATAIATAHTADDQLETLLMRLARGTGLSGAAGMRSRRGAWIKPLLAVTRAEIERDLTAHGLAWREDASNARPDQLRNRIRHHAVPALLDALRASGASPAARRAGLARRAGELAAELAEAERTLARVAARALDRARRETSAGATYDARVIASLPVAIQRLALRRAWRLLGVPGVPGLTGRHIAPLLAGLGAPSAAGREAKSTSRVALPAGWEARLAAGLLRFAPHSALAPRPGHVARRAGPTDARVHGGRRRARIGSEVEPSKPRRASPTRVRKRPPAWPATRQERP